LAIANPENSKLAIKSAINWLFFEAILVILGLSLLTINLFKNNLSSLNSSYYLINAKNQL
jgi:hypothetical protein